MSGEILQCQPSACRECTTKPARSVKPFRRCNAAIRQAAKWQASGKSSRAVCHGKEHDASVVSVN